jgi:hypothetical protein
MTHDEARELIPAFAASKLRGPALDGLRAHLSACGECAEVASGIAGMVAALQEGGPALFTAHPQEKLLRSFFERATTPAETERIEAHLKTCASCSLEVSAKQRAPVMEQLPEGRSRDRAGASGWQLGTAAAGILAVGVLIGLAVSAGRSSRATATGASPGTQPAWSGPVDLHVLPAPQRGEAVTRFVLKKGQPATILHLARVFPAGGNLEDRIRLLVQSDKGVVRFDRVYKRSEMERAFESWGVMPIFLPASTLPAGRYELIVQRDDPSAEKIAAIPFEVTREE